MTRYRPAQAQLNIFIYFECSISQRIIMEIISTRNQCHMLAVELLLFGIIIEIEANAIRHFMPNIFHRVQHNRFMTTFSIDIMNFFFPMLLSEYFHFE